MATNRKTGPRPGTGLREREQRAWLVYMQIYLRLTYEMNHELLTDSGLAGEAPGGLGMTPQKDVE